MCVEFCFGLLSFVLLFGDAIHCDFRCLKIILFPVPDVNNYKLTTCFLSDVFVSQYLILTPSTVIFTFTTTKFFNIDVISLNNLTKFGRLGIFEGKSKI